MDEQLEEAIKEVIASLLLDDLCVSERVVEKIKDIKVQRKLIKEDKHDRR